jgi:hypothetical protein
VVLGIGKAKAIQCKKMQPSQKSGKAGIIWIGMERRDARTNLRIQIWKYYPQEPLFFINAG